MAALQDSHSARDRPHAFGAKGDIRGDTGYMRPGHAAVHLPPLRVSVPYSTFQTVNNMRKHRICSTQNAADNSRSSLERGSNRGDLIQQLLMRRFAICAQARLASIKTDVRRTVKSYLTHKK
jgi:hypothetical protein